MTQRVILYMLTCGPFVLTLCAWTKLYWGRERQWPDAVALVPLGVVSANAALAVGTFLYYLFRPSPSWLPPWEDPQILTLGLLFFLAPIGIILGIIAGVRGNPKWLICIVEIASVPLLVVGLMAGAQFELKITLITPHSSTRF
jgi:hypothetical protein